LAMQVVAIIAYPVIGTAELGRAALSVSEIFTPTDPPPVDLVSDVVHVLFYFYTSYALVRYLFGDDWVTRDDLFAVGAAFTVLTWDPPTPLTPSSSSRRTRSRTSGAMVISRMVGLTIRRSRP
ncbi:MAG: hypothetical protein ABI131_12595, partial [Nostocoides sp.]